VCGENKSRFSALHPSTPRAIRDDEMEYNIERKKNEVKDGAVTWYSRRSD
jgi:hypothetical protein